MTTDLVLNVAGQPGERSWSQHEVAVAGARHLVRQKLDMPGHLSLVGSRTGQYGGVDKCPGNPAIEGRQFTMSVQGKWDLAVARPDGTVSVTLELALLGNAVTGTSTRSDGLTADILNGVFDGETLAYDVEIQNPISATLHFALVVSGDTMSGTFSSEQIGEGKASGKRI